MSMYWIDATDDTIHSCLLGHKIKIKLDRWINCYGYCEVYILLYIIHFGRYSIVHFAVNIFTFAEKMYYFTYTIFIHTNINICTFMY